MVEVGVSAREFSPEMVLPVNENDPTGGDVTNKPCAFRNVIFRADEAGSLGLGGVSARDFSLAEAIPVNENVPRGDDVFTLLVVGALEFSPEGALRVNENDPRGDKDSIEVEVSAWEFSPEGRSPSSKRLSSGAGRSLCNFFFSLRQAFGVIRFLSGD